MFVLFYLQLDATLYISPEEWTGGQTDWQVHHCRVLLSLSYPVHIFLIYIYIHLFTLKFCNLNLGKDP